MKIGDKVKILPLEKCPGRILSIWETAKGFRYEVRYFNSGKLEEVYFFLDELEPQQEEL